MIEVGVLGATGIVGQRFIEILNDHPWFRISALAASEKSVKKRYSEIGKWRLGFDPPNEIASMKIVSPNPKKMSNVDIVFSALPSSVAGDIEKNFAKSGIIVISNAASHRMDPFVPVMNPEVNPTHLNLIEGQRKERKWKGAILTNPNCTTSVLTLSLKPILDKLGIRNVIMTSMQAVSGAGYPGVSSLDIIDNVIPYIQNEEEKVEEETKKILGSINNPASFNVSASCNRVPTIDGHIESVFIETLKDADVNTAIRAMENFSSEPQKFNLPTAPEKPVIVRKEMDRPQPRFDRMEGDGMSVVIGRIRSDPVFRGIKYTVLGHNLMRGAAGCTVLVGELVKAKGLLE